MTDEIADAALNMRLRTVDPLPPDSLPSPEDTEAALRRLLATGAAGARTGPRLALSRRLRFARPRLLAGATASAGAVTAGVVLLLGVTTSSPAFAVTRNADGTVTVRLTGVSGIPGANAKLASMGVRARIVGSVDEARQVATMHLCRGTQPGWRQTVTIHPSAIPPSQVVLLTADRAARLRAYAAAYAAAVKFRDATGNPAAGAQVTGNSATGNTGSGNSGPGSRAPGTPATTVAPGQVTVICAVPVGWLTPASG